MEHFLFLASNGFSYLFGFSLNWFPIGRAYGNEINPGYNFPFFISALYHAFLPALTLVFVSLGGWMLSMRNTMISTLGSDYITFAHAKGIPSKLIMLRYAARNAILPNLTGFGMALGFMLRGIVDRDDFFLSRSRFLIITSSSDPGLSSYARYFYDNYARSTWCELAC